MLLLPGGLDSWSVSLLKGGYPPLEVGYIFSAEVPGALLFFPSVFSRYVALHAVPMMIGASRFWLVRNGFYFTAAGAEFPLVWLALRWIYFVGGDRAYALVRSPDLPSLARRLSAIAAVK